MRDGRGFRGKTAMALPRSVSAPVESKAPRACRQACAAARAALSGGVGNGKFVTCAHAHNGEVDHIILGLMALIIVLSAP